MSCTCCCGSPPPSPGAKPAEFATGVGSTETMGSSTYITVLHIGICRVHWSPTTPTATGSFATAPHHRRPLPEGVAPHLWSNSGQRSAYSLAGAEYGVVFMFGVCRKAKHTCGDLDDVGLVGYYKVPINSRVRYTKGPAEINQHNPPLQFSNG